MGLGLWYLLENPHLFLQGFQKPKSFAHFHRGLQISNFHYKKKTYLAEPSQYLTKTALVFFPLRKKKKNISRVKDPQYHRMKPHVRAIASHGLQLFRVSFIHCLEPGFHPFINGWKLPNFRPFKKRLFSAPRERFLAMALVGLLRLIT